ncbi:hypothetical protein TWF506_011116 [Arthrobotrys conoides]|uniref:Uncharacterized protein n=1 Tax=Arthrobotrys conoides TaxID=74498 RepID=A0AAN8RVA9_9PEZI
MYSFLANIISLSFFGLATHLAFTSAYEIGFLGYDDGSDIIPTDEDVVWTAVPPDSDTKCHYITPRWADNVEYAFIRTTPDQEPIPRFIGLYGNNGRPPTGCNHNNLKVIIKWQPELGDRLQVADTLKRDINRWAVLVPNTERTERLVDILEVLENDRNFAGGRVAWRLGSGYWHIDQDTNRIFGLDETSFELPQRDILDSENESDYNYEDNGNNDNGEDGENNEESIEEDIEENIGGIGNALSYGSPTASTAGSQLADAPNARPRIIPGTNPILDAFRIFMMRHFQPMAGLDTVLDANELDNLLNFGLDPQMEDIPDTLSLGTNLGIEEPEPVGATRLMRELSGTDSNLETDWNQGNPLDELE